MAVYDLEEQEQLEDLKAWWRRWGNLITAVIVAVSVAIVGVQGWRWWKQRQAEQASTLYTAATDGVRGNDLAKTRDAVSQLTDRFSSTPYASSGALLLARMLFEKGDKAGASTQLQWVIDHADDEIRQIARYRLAQVQLDNKQYDDALRTLDAKHDDAFDGLYADLRGDILGAAGKPAEARSAYETAVNKLDPKSPYRSYVQVKLDALGGPTAAAADAPAAARLPGATPAPAATAAAAPPPPAATAPIADLPANTPGSGAPAPSAPPSSKQ